MGQINVVVSLHQIVLAGFKRWYNSCSFSFLSLEVCFVSCDPLTCGHNFIANNPTSSGSHFYSTNALANCGAPATEWCLASTSGPYPLRLIIRVSRPIVAEARLKTKEYSLRRPVYSIAIPWVCRTGSRLTVPLGSSDRSRRPELFRRIDTFQ